MKREAGFTLIEVLVAVAVLSIALAAMIQTGGHTANQLTYLQDRTLAHWVAMNELTRLQVTRAWPSPGATGGGQAEMGNRLWAWRTMVTQTPDDTVRRVEVEVREVVPHAGRRGNETPLARLSGFLGRP
ncbi:MAG: type II secretion system minor pseudopilin GspI [Magnetococcales bacterium]|nr:type II secretion system minor pseudopilin GspI [Magnetococcales bacterium]